MASLANQTISSTYDGLIKTSSDNAVPVSGVQALEDGSGNALALSVGRSGNGVTVSGNLAVDTNTLYVDAANNRVGVGTSSPTSAGGYAKTLQVSDSSSASISVSRTSATASSIEIGTFSGSNLIDSIGSGIPLRFKVDGSERMRIDSSGNVGIGESNPANTLTIKDEGYQIAIIDESSGNVSEILSSNDSMGFFADRGNAIANSKMLFSVDGTERMRIDSSGRVGIGESVPLVPLHISRDSASGENIALILDNNNTTANSEIGLLFRAATGGQNTDFQIATINTAANQANLVFRSDGAVERMRIDSSGNVGIGLTPSMKFQVKSSGTSTEDVASFGNANISDGLVVTTNGNLDWGLNARNTRNLTFSTNQSERMRITSGGDVLIGTQTAIASLGNTIQVKNNSNLAYFQFSGDVASSGSIVFRNPANSTVGTITISNTATAYNTSSDYRLKENVVEMIGALDRVDALKPSRFNFIGEDRTVDGFLAHEVQAIVPEAVTGEKDAVDEEGNPIYQGIDQSKIVPLLVGAIKELSAKVAALESQLNA